MSVMRKAFFCFIAPFLFLAPPLFAAEWFDIEVKVITTGENQPQREIGVFGAEVPLGGKGYMERSVSINNQTRDKKNQFDFKISMKPERLENGRLHIILTSEVTPALGKEESRFRDLRYDNPTSQIVEIFSDPVTGTRLLIALSIAPKEIKKELIPELKVVFRTNVEKIHGGVKEAVDSYDLQSIGETPVGRTLTQSVPIWVEGDTGEATIEGLREIDSSSAPVTLKAGEGFTYSLPKELKKEREKTAKKQRKKADNRLPAVYQNVKQEEKEEPAPSQEAPPEPGAKPKTLSGSYDWKKESFNFEIVSEPELGGAISCAIKMEGSLYDKEKKMLEELPPKEETRTFSNGELAVFSILNPEGDGYVLTLQPNF